jgi:hypothetical protein
VDCAVLCCVHDPGRHGRRERTGTHGLGTRQLVRKGWARAGEPTYYVKGGGVNRGGECSVECPPQWTLESVLRLVPDRIPVRLELPGDEISAVIFPEWREIIQLAVG